MADGIVFEQLSSEPAPSIEDVGYGVLYLQGFGSSTSYAEGAAGFGRLRFVQIAQSLEDAPSVPQLGFGSGELTFFGGFGIAPGVMQPADGNALLRLEGFGYEASDVGRGELTLFGSAVSVRDGDVLPTAPGTGEWAVMRGDLGATDTLIDLDYIVARSMLNMKGALKTRSQLHAKLRSALALEDQLALVYKVLLQDSLEMGDGFVLSYVALARMHDHLLMSGIVNTSAEAWLRISEAIAFGAALEALELLPFADAVTMADTARAYATAAAKMIDEVVFADDLIGTGLFMALMSDTVQLSDAVTSFAEAMARMRDSLAFSIHFTLEDGHYTAWTMNTDSKASTRYDNYPFNSFMQVGTNHYGVSDTGVFRLTGDTDNGEPIQAHIRLGMSALGSRLKKHVPSVYLGYSADGDMFIKAIVADNQTGTREAHVYRLYANDSAGSQREARTKFGKGLEAIYWDFQIENVDGANFDIDNIEFMPLQVNRRLRGNAGGK